MRASSIALCFCIVLAGCATGDRSATAGGAYRSTQLERNVFRVSVEGNVLSTQEATDRTALLHGAQVARQHGFPWFMASGAAATGTALSIAFTTIRIPASTITITCFVERPETSATVYEADVMIANAGR